MNFRSQCKIMSNGLLFILSYGQSFGSLDLAYQAQAHLNYYFREIFLNIVLGEVILPRPPHSGQKEKRRRNEHMCVTPIHFPFF